MASAAGDLIFTSKEGGTSSFILFGGVDDAVAAGTGITWRSVSAGRKSPWEIIQYPANSAIRAKFMGAKPKFFVISGTVYSPAGSITVMRDGLELLTFLNTKKDHFTIATGGQIIHAGEGVIIEDILFDFMGRGTGPVWDYQMFLRDLGI